MGWSILITGAAGYIGGTVLETLKTSANESIKDAKISAAVRSEEQMQALSKLGINVIRVDLDDQVAVHDAIIRNEIDLVINTASAVSESLATSIIKALGKRRQISGSETYFIHSSVSAIYSKENGWPSGEVRDTDPIYGQEKQIDDFNPVRKANVLITEEAKAQGVKSLIIAIPSVYGRGSGQWRKLSVDIPAFIRTSIKHRVVYKFDVEGNPPAVHVTDLAKLFTIIVEKILRKQPISSGEKGYYFPIVHRAPRWEVLHRLVKVLHERGLVDEPEVHTWPNDDMAADYLGFPRAFVRVINTNSGELIPVKAYELGWQPMWDQKRFFESIEDEIDAVLELDTIKPTLFSDLSSPSAK